MSSNFEELGRIYKAVIVNTARPQEDEEFNVDRKLQTSKRHEENSQFGMELFCGVASVRFSKEEVRDFLGLEFPEEYESKVSKFREKYAKGDEKLLRKVKLIQNHIRLNRVD